MNKNFDEDSAFATAHAEALGSDRKPGLWARAISQSDGDEKRAIASYIGQRVEQLRRFYLDEVESARLLEEAKEIAEIDARKKLEKIATEAKIRSDTQVMTVFEIERKLKEEFGVITHIRRGHQEWIFRDQNGLIGTFIGESVFRDAALSIFLGVSPRELKKKSEANNVDHVIESGIFDDGGFFDPKMGMARAFWIRFFIPNAVFVFIKNLIFSSAGGVGPIFIVFCLFVALYGFLSIICVWRAADIYEGPRYLAYATKIYLVVSLFLGLITGLSSI